MIETLRHIDHQLFYWINIQIQNPLFDWLMPLLRQKLVWIPLYIWLAYTFFKTYGAETFWLMAIAAITILLSDQISSSLIKPFVHRLRPCNNAEIHARLLIEYCGAGYSFVSSHAANHFALATLLSFLALNKKRWVPLLYLWAFAVALAQVYVGVHFPADVAGGALLGIAIGLGTGLVAKKIVAPISPKN